MSVPSEMREAADRWMGRLHGEETTHPDREAFERWRADPAHASAYEEAARLYGSFQQLQGRADLKRLSERILRETEPRVGRWSKHRVPLALAASLVICVLAGGAFLAGRYYLPTESYSTAFGERSTVRLEDGSEVILNSATRLTVRIGNDQRHFTLDQGEAMFAVAQDPTRPFTVSAADGRVTALGTRFQVRSENSEVTVTLLEGRIAVDREEDHQPVQLKLGEQVRFSSGKAGMDRRMVDLDAVSSWVSGRLKFKSSPLTEVLAEVNRYSRTQIHLADTTLASTPVNATFDMGDSASVASALEVFLPVEAVQRQRHEIVLVRKR
jgi:transmembrane sensor